MFAFIGRVILIVIALSAIRSAIQFVQKIFAPGSGTVARRAPQQPLERRGATLLKQDPVCGTYVAGDQSLKRIVRGQVIHFCSPECRDRFQSG